MTFYNIIFGILFIGAFREVAYYSLGQWMPANFFMATTLAVLVFSDTIYTSLVIEGMSKRYRMTMKLLDLLSFILLSFAVVLLNPVSSDLFEFDARPVLGLFHNRLGGTNEAYFWLLLAAYMLILTAWNMHLAPHHAPKANRWTRAVQPGFAAVFTLMAGLSWWLDLDTSYLLMTARLVVTIGVLLYLLLFKTYYVRQLSAPPVELKPLTAGDVTAIHQWANPGYQGDLQQLSYALGNSDDGWLQKFPESNLHRRFAIWHNDRLAGFTLLTDINQAEAEFYIALDPDKMSQRLGPTATRLTLRKGFEELQLKRIHLKVRHWYESAQSVYTCCGFEFCRGNKAEKHEPVCGHDVLFYCMECYRPWWLSVLLWKRRQVAALKKV